MDPAWIRRLQPCSAEAVKRLMVLRRLLRRVGMTSDTSLAPVTRLARWKTMSGRIAETISWTAANSARSARHHRRPDPLDTRASRETACNSAPQPFSRRQRCEPMKPLAPVIRMRWPPNRERSQFMIREIPPGARARRASVPPIVPTRREVPPSPRYRATSGPRRRD